MRPTLAENVPDLVLAALNKNSQLKNGNVCEVTWTGFFGVVNVRCSFSITSYDQYMTLSYEIGGQSYRYNVWLCTTEPFFGGKRYWFICPLRCDRRVGVLYLVSGYFGCRHCQGVKYKSQYTTHTGRFRQLYLAGRFLKLSVKINALRTKFFKGKPTKRIRRYLERQSDINTKL